MKVFITGGAGFIGSHVTDKFIEAGHEVTIIDHCLEKKRYFINKRANFIKKPINHPKVLKAIKKEKPDIICHLAAQISVPISVQNPAFDAQTNIADSLVFAKACADIKVKKFIFASSGGAMYGETSPAGADENSPAEPISPYGLSKVVFENYLKLFGELYDLPWISLRLANVYGPRQQVTGEAGVIAIFLDNILSSQESTIFGDGQASRDFIFVDDVARAFLLSAEKSVSNLGLNIGTGSATTVNEIWSEINKNCQNKGKVNHGPARIGDINFSSLNPELAKDELGFEAEIPLASGLRQTAEWYIENFN